MPSAILNKIKKSFSGYVNIGNRLTIYGRNAMHWGVTFRTKKFGYICFRLPLMCYGRWWPMYLYFSPNATPWAATFMIGRGHDSNCAMAKLRKYMLGHNFSYDSENNDANYQILQMINREFRGGR